MPTQPETTTPHLTYREFEISMWHPIAEAQQMAMDGAFPTSWCLYFDPETGHFGEMCDPWINFEGDTRLIRAWPATPPRNPA